VAVIVVMFVAGGYIVATKAISRGGGSPNTAPTSGPAAGLEDAKLLTHVYIAHTHSDVPEQPSPQNPVTAVASAVPFTVRPGEIVELAVTIRIAPGWHIYSTDESGGPAERTTLELKVPAGIEQDSGWVVPEPELDASGTGPVARVYTGDVTFRCQLRLADDVSRGRREMGCRLGFQACDRYSCKPFKTQSLVASLNVSDSTGKEH
jgi:DsbC/DsbD-like thiol-disulfide interchange protein